MRRVRKQNKQAKAQQNSVIFKERVVFGKTQMVPQSTQVVGTLKSSRRHFWYNVQNGSVEFYSQIPVIDYGVAPKFKISPKSRRNQIMETTGLSLGIPIPEQLEKNLRTLSTARVGMRD